MSAFTPSQKALHRMKTAMEIGTTKTPILYRMSSVERNDQLSQSQIAFISELELTQLKDN